MQMLLFQVLQVESATAALRKKKGFDRRDLVAVWTPVPTASYGDISVQLWEE